MVDDLRIKTDYLTFAVDISKEEQVREIAKDLESSFGKIDCLINTAGICGKYDLVENYCFVNFKRIYEVNVFGTFLMMKYFISLMKNNGKGSIVNFSSVSGIRGYDFEIGYGSSKWAVIGMTKTAAVEYGKFNVRVNCVAPGWVDTEMMQCTIENYNELSSKNDDCCISYGPMNRSASPEEISNVVYFLCSKEASFINGENIVIDGGKTAI